MNEPQTADDFERFRADFPGAANGPYLDVADRGLISNEVRSALTGYFDACASGETKELARTSMELARQLFAQLVRAAPDEIALVKNVSDGINTVANAIDWKPGDNVVVCEALEHPGNLYVWRNLRDRRGIAIHNVAPDNWAIDADRMIAAIDARTRIVSASMVTFAPGFRLDVTAVGEACRARGALFLVDAAQAIGVLDVDLSALPIDALAVGTPKALLGLYGMGFLFVRRAITSRLRPAYLSGAGADGRAPYGANDDRLSLKPHAARFEVGNANHAGCVAAAASLGQLLALGPARIERHSVRLAAQLADGLEERGLAVLRPSARHAASNIVAAGSRLEDSLDTTSDPDLLALGQHLLARRIGHSVRRGVLRFSVHAYNTAADVEETLRSVSEWRSRRHRTAPGVG